MEPQAQKIIIRATQDMGLQEVPRGSNDGARLRSILRRTPFKPGEKWCYYWALAVMLDVFGDVGSLPQSVLVTGSCDDAARHASHFGKLSMFPATGCIFVLSNTEGRFYHCGFVTDVLSSAGIIRTAEGNTNDNGSANGYGVFHHSRAMSSLLRYIIW